MKGLFYYLIQVTVSSGVLYCYYHFVLRNKKFHSYNRYYLLAATIISLLAPLLNIPVYFRTETTSSVALQTLKFISSHDVRIFAPASLIVSVKHHGFHWQDLLISCYILVSLVILARITFSILRIRQLTKTYPVEKIDRIYLVNTKEPETPFSFFRWLFWNQKIELRSEKGGQIFRHELFHIAQRHSYYILYLELLTTIFWINPFFHLIKKEIKTIHEFLADSFALTPDKKWEYAEILLMQSLNTQQHLVNPFFQNQLKRRIAMITSSQKTSHQYLRKLLVLPVITFIFVLFAFKVNSHLQKVITAPTKPVTEIINTGSEVNLTTGNRQKTDTSKPKTKQKQKEPAKQKAEENEQKELKEMLEKSQLDAEKEQVEFKHLVEEKQLEEEKQQLELKQTMILKQMETEKAELEFKQLMTRKQQAAEEEQLEFKKRIDTLNNKEREEAMKKFKLLMDDKQREAEKMQQEFEQTMKMKQQQAEKNGEELKQVMIMRQKAMEIEQQEFKKRMLEKQLEIEKKSNTNSKKVKT